MSVNTPPVAPWFTDLEHLRLALTSDGEAVPPERVRAVLEALTDDDEYVDEGPWVVPAAPWGVDEHTITGVFGRPVFRGADYSPAVADHLTASWVAAVRTEHPALVAATRAVLGLHEPSCRDWRGEQGTWRWCVACDGRPGDYLEHTWPCETVTTFLGTLAEALGAGLEQVSTVCHAVPVTEPGD